MLETLVLFAVLTYGIAFLLADAKIFGCPATDYLDRFENPNIGASKGMIPIRQFFLGLRTDFFRSLLRCYFCMGVWCGALAHLLIVVSHRSGLYNLGSYFLLGPDLPAIAIGTLDAALLGGPVCYVMDLAVKAMEKVAD